MGELIGDVCVPSCFILPTQFGTAPSETGQMMISGATIIWYDGSSVQTISGSNTGDA